MIPPADIAAQPNAWNPSIRDLDEIIDRLHQRAIVLVNQPDLQSELRCAEVSVRSVRDHMLAVAYDENRRP